MNKHFDNIVGILGVTAGLVGIGYALGTHSKMTKISEKLDRSIDELANDVPVDIPKDMIERAVEKAVSYEVREAAKKAADSVSISMKNDIHTQVKNAVDAEYNSIKDSVLEELVTSASKIDATRVRSDIERSAKAKALEKFDDKLDDIVDDFKEKLDDYMCSCKESVAVVNKVYKRLTDEDSRSREHVIRIG